MHSVIQLPLYDVITSLANSEISECTIFNMRFFFFLTGLSFYKFQRAEQFVLFTFLNIRIMSYGLQIVFLVSNLKVHKKKKKETIQQKCSNIHYFE